MASRDEKGLTLSHRTMLRIFMNFSEALNASHKIGENGSWELLQHPTILLELRTLLWMSSQIVKKIGGYDEVAAYLRAHRDEDEKTALEGMRADIKEESARGLADMMLEQAGAPKCTACGNFKCPMCGECHHCKPEAAKDDIGLGIRAKAGNRPN